MKIMRDNWGTFGILAKKIIEDQAHINATINGWVEKCSILFRQTKLCYQHISMSINNNKLSCSEHVHQVQQTENYPSIYTRWHRNCLSCEFNILFASNRCVISMRSIVRRPFSQCNTLARTTSGCSLRRKANDDM